MTTALLAEQVSSLGFKARVKRVARLMTQEELAELVGVSREDVSLLESGETLAPETAQRLLIHLGINRA